MADINSDGMELYIVLSTAPAVPLCWIGTITVIHVLLLTSISSEDLGN
jgi:hypothetical protein